MSCINPVQEHCTIVRKQHRRSVIVSKIARYVPRARSTLQVKQHSRYRIYYPPKCFLRKKFPIALPAPIRDQHILLQAAKVWLLNMMPGKIDKGIKAEQDSGDEMQPERQNMFPCTRYVICSATFGCAICCTGIHISRPSMWFCNQSLAITARNRR